MLPRPHAQLRLCVATVPPGLEDPSCRKHKGHNKRFQADFKDKGPRCDLEDGAVISPYVHTPAFP